MQRTGLNRHRRDYVTAEAATGVHFSMPGPIRARPVSYFKYHDSIIIFLIIITSCISKKIKILFYHYRYYSTKHSIRSYTNHQGKFMEFGNQFLPHASSCQTTPTNLNAQVKYLSNCINLNVCKTLDGDDYGQKDSLFLCSFVLVIHPKIVGTKFKLI